MSGNLAGKNGGVQLLALDQGLRIPRLKQVLAVIRQPNVNRDRGFGLQSTRVVAVDVAQTKRPRIGWFWFQLNNREALAERLVARNELAV